MASIRDFFRGNARHVLTVLLVTLAGVAVGSFVGYLLGSAVVGAVLTGLVAFYLTSDSSWVSRADPRTRGLGGGGQGGGA